MEKYEYKQLRITDLLLNVNNPRFNPVEHQLEAVHAMIEDQGEKLVELAKHIATHGLSPMEIILVQPFGGYWIIREGNRRVTALKLINEPELVPETKAKLKKEFISLSLDIEDSLLRNIPCVIVTNEEIINEWIRLKHTGENKGIGTVSWDAQQTSRFATQISGKSDPRTQLFESLRMNEDIPHTLRGNFSAIKKTNYDRLLGDPQVRKLLGVETKNGEYYLAKGVNAYLLTILSDLTAGDFSVGKIYSKSDRETYLKEVNERVAQNDIAIAPSPVSNIHTSVTPAHTPEGPSIPLDKQVPEVGGKAGKKNYPINRKYLIPAQHKLTIMHARVLKIFNELKVLDCEQYPNAVSVLFRVFIELSCDCYIESRKISEVNVDSKFGKKITAVADDIENKKLMSKNDLHIVRKMTSDQTQNQSVRTFHSYVHNKSVTPVASELKAAWDDLWTFIEMMWR